MPDINIAKPETYNHVIQMHKEDNRGEMRAAREKKTKKYSLKFLNSDDDDGRCGECLSESAFCVYLGLN